MKVKKATAGAVLAATLPALAGTRVDPYEDRPWKIWLNGVWPLAVAGAMMWAGEQLKEHPEKPVTQSS